MRDYIPDHPVIRNLERTGTPDGFPERIPICPVCGDECGTYYVAHGVIIGCDRCVDKCDAYDWEDER